MPRCSHTYADLTQCRRIVSAEQTYCFGHDPAQQEKRKTIASRGGKAKAISQSELARVKAKLKRLSDQTIAGEIDTRVAAVASQVLNTLIAALRVEQKERELVEHEQRLAELEELARSRQPIRGGRLKP